MENNSDKPDGSSTSATDSRGSDRNSSQVELSRVERHHFWKFQFRPDDDDEPQDWWFASTAIPLLAATVGPLANILSIAALVTSWRQNLSNNGAGPDVEAVGFPDPRWCIALNAASLACGFAGNFFLLLNFTRRIRYIIALPMTILLWYLATGILISIIAAMHRYVPPVRPQQTYSQGFWYAIIAAVLYLINAMILMVNMLGYFLGHYPQHFTLSDHQRTLILQTMMFFLWLAGGAGVFARVCSWSYADALYFCDVTVLTIGFGDFAAPNDAGKGLVFPFSVGGIVMLGLVVSSINKFTTEISHDKVIKKHVEKERRRTVSRSVTKPIEAPPERPGIAKERGKISAPIPRPRQAVSFGRTTTEGQQPHRRLHSASNRRLKRRMKHLRQMTPKRPREIVLREEKDRFDAMRKIQHNTNRFKRWYNLSMSVTAFGLLWCVGAAVFWKAERREQGLTYFQALYFCYVSLLTIGYGDLSPRSNAGKPFFVVWSLVAVPTMTILIGDLSDTVIASFKRGTVTLADLTVLPQAGRWKSFLLKIGIWSWVQRKVESRAEKKRIAGGFLVAEDEEAPPTIEELAQAEPTDQDLAKKLALAIRRVADHLNAEPAKRYSYEEWVEFTRLIRFSTESDMAVEADEEEEGLIEWDWIGENSPMLAEQSEAEWILDRLCESLSRYMTRHSRHHKHRRRMRQPADGPLMEKVEEEGPEEADEAEEDEGEKYGGASRKERSTENRS